MACCWQRRQRNGWPTNWSKADKPASKRLFNQALTYRDANASQALTTINLGDDLTGSDPNPSAGYPIVTFTWVLLYKNGNAAKLPLLQRTFNYALSEAAQQQAPSLGYIPMPAPVLAKAKDALARVGP